MEKDTKKDTKKDMKKDMEKVMLAPAKASGSSSNEHDMLDKWATNHAAHYVLHCVDKFTDTSSGQQYIATWPVNFAFFKMSGSNAKMVIEFPAKVRRVYVQPNASSDDIFTAKATLAGQVKKFMLKYAKEQLKLHPELELTDTDLTALHAPHNVECL